MEKRIVKQISIKTDDNKNPSDIKAIGFGFGNGEYIHKDIVKKIKGNKCFRTIKIEKNDDLDIVHGTYRIYSNEDDYLEINNEQNKDKLNRVFFLFCNKIPQIDGFTNCIFAYSDFVIEHPNINFGGCHFYSLIFNKSCRDISFSSCHIKTDLELSCLVRNNEIESTKLKLELNIFYNFFICQGCVFTSRLNHKGEYIENILPAIPISMTGKFIEKITRKPEFTQNVEFNISKNIFYGKVIFREAIFGGKVSFKESVFHKDVIFNNIKFRCVESNNIDDSFYRNIIPQYHLEAFNGQEDISFRNTVFKDSVEFNGTKFYGRVSFDKSYFEKDSKFHNCEFHSQMNFYQTSFYSSVSFTATTFLNPVVFMYTDIYKSMILRESRFKKSLNLTYLNFLNDGGIESFSVYIDPFKSGNSVPSFYKNGLKWVTEAHKLIKKGENRSVDESLQLKYIKNDDVAKLISSKDSQETYRILKKESIRKADTINAINMYKKECEHHYKTLKWDSKNFFNKLILCFEKNVSNYGTNAFKAILILFILNIFSPNTLIVVFAIFIFVSINYLFSLGKSDIKVPLLINSLLFTFAILLSQKVNIVYFLDMVANNLPFSSYLKNVTVSQVFHIVINGVLIYEIQKSFRKYSRQL